MLEALQTAASVRPLRRVEYNRLVTAGAFDRERLELIRGSLVSMSPIGPEHCDVLTALAEHLRSALVGQALVRTQMPLVAFDESEPEPDIALVVPGRYRGHHPSESMLVIEVADSSLEYDRAVKAPLYAASRVSEYWIVNLRQHVIEVFRDSDGARWQTTFVVRAPETVTPVRFPNSVVDLSDLF